MSLEESEGCVKMNCFVFSDKVCHCNQGMRFSPSLPMFIYGSETKTESGAGSTVQSESTSNKARCERMLAFCFSYFSPTWCCTHFNSIVAIRTSSERSLSEPGNKFHHEKSKQEETPFLTSPIIINTSRFPKLRAL